MTLIVGIGTRRDTSLCTCTGIKHHPHPCRGACSPQRATPHTAFSYLLEASLLGMLVLKDSILCLTFHPRIPIVAGVGDRKGQGMVIIP